MSATGFRPNWTGDASHVEYVKDFAEPDGRIGRLTVLFSKAGYSTVMDSAQLTGFVITVQGRVDPVIDEVKDKAPKAMQADMLHALAVLEGIAEPGEDQESALCDHCGFQLEEWTVDDNGNIQCMRPETCSERRG